MSTVQSFNYHRGALLLLCVGLLGCNNRQSIIVPNRVLDRPTEMAMACVSRDPDSQVITTKSLEECGGATCSGENRLIGFIANSERDDVAMFSTCANSVIDMDESTPGAQLIPAGKVPTTMALTKGNPDGCYAVSGNLGSCDLSLFDVTGFAAYAYEDVPVEDPSSLVQTFAPVRGDGTPLGSRPGQIVPVPYNFSNSVLFDDPTPDEGDDDGGDESGASGEAGGTGGEGPVLRCDPERPGSIYVTFPSCQLVAEIDLRTHRILQSRQFISDDDGYVEVIDSGANPVCPIDCPEQFGDYPQLLADSPPGEADGMYPSALALVTPPLIDPENADSALNFDLADQEVKDASLYVGGLGSDTLFELRYEGTQWTDALRLDLPDASGISVIRATPSMHLPFDPEAGPYHQFLYVIAGDGSTRVVRREFDTGRDTPGVECDTQLDPSTGLSHVCFPADNADGAPQRRPFARGPGIRAAGGALITDWTFQKLIRCADETKPPSLPSYCLQSLGADDSLASSPFGQYGVIGIGTTTFGRLVFLTFGQFYLNRDGKLDNLDQPLYDRTPVVDPIEVDPMGLLDATILPHMAWPGLDPTLTRGQGLDTTGLPRMVDADPVRSLSGDADGANAIKVLAPSLRRIDLAYSDDYEGIKCSDKFDCPEAICGDPDDAGFEECINAQCGTGQPCVCPDPGMSCKSSADCPPNVSCAGGMCVAPDGCTDKMGCGPDGFCGANTINYLSPQVDNADRFGISEAEGQDKSDGLYEKETVRAVVRDYRSWIGGDWRVVWEGEIPGSESLQGQLVCENPGWEGGTCISTEPGDTRMVDTTAKFCDVGVLAGDKLALFDCADDGDCGEGQYCLVDPRTPGNVSGICVSQQAYQSTERLLQVCRDLVYDPCGQPRREWLITRAYQDELWLQALDIPVSSYLMFSEAPKVDEDTKAEFILEPGEDGEPDPEGESDKTPDPGDEVLDVCNGEYIDSVIRNTEGHPQDPDLLTVKPYECEARLVCAPEQPESGCETHADCVTQTREDEGADRFYDDPADFKELYPLCIEGSCRRICRDYDADGDGKPDEDCVMRRLPGPECLRELVHYTVTARNSFIVTGPGSFGFLNQRVKADPETGECYESNDVSNLLTSRIRLGEDYEDTRYNSAWPVPLCEPGSERPDGNDPNPCFIEAVRPAGLTSMSPQNPVNVFHQFIYGNASNNGPVPAIRYSNPMMSLVLDLTSLLALTGTVPDHDDKNWPPEFREFKRSRIPRNFTESFTTLQGYVPFDVGVVTSNLALIGPTRIVNAPELAGVFVVDTSGGGGTTGVRGQIVKVNLSGGQVSPDTAFQVH